MGLHRIEWDCIGLSGIEWDGVGLSGIELGFMKNSVLSLLLFPFIKIIKCRGKISNFTSFKYIVPIPGLE